MLDLAEQVILDRACCSMAIREVSILPQMVQESELEFYSPLLKQTGPNHL